MGRAVVMSLVPVVARALGMIVRLVVVRRVVVVLRALVRVRPGRVVVVLLAMPMVHGAGVAVVEVRVAVLRFLGLEFRLGGLGLLRQGTHHGMGHEIAAGEEGALVDVVDEDSLDGGFQSLENQSDQVVRERSFLLYLVHRHVDRIPDGGINVDDEGLFVVAQKDDAAAEQTELHTEFHHQAQIEHRQRLKHMDKTGHIAFAAHALGHGADGNIRPALGDGIQHLGYRFMALELIAVIGLVCHCFPQLYTDPLPFRDAWANTFYLGYQYSNDRLQFKNRIKWEVVNQVDYDKRPVEQQDIRESASFLGILNKLDYTFDLGIVKFQPRWKSEFQRYRPAEKEDSQIRVATTELRELFSLIARVPILSRTELQTGVEYLLVEQYRKKMENNSNNYSINNFNYIFFYPIFFN